MNEGVSQRFFKIVFLSYSTFTSFTPKMVATHGPSTSLNVAHQPFKNKNQQIVNMKKTCQIPAGELIIYIYSKIS